MKTVLAFFAALFCAQSFASGLVVCTKADPSFNWYQIMDNRLGWQGRGPALIINAEKKRVTWMGTGGYIQLTGERNSRGVKIIRIDGRAAQERIMSSTTTGQVTDFQLEDSLGGVGLLRLFMDKNGTGRANWQHATDTSKEDLAYCTDNVLND